jgi:2-polyprenyl-3-methyl-5-hydroxy-6-metoxy-1,4-benzoquinol methylase
MNAKTGNTTIADTMEPGGSVQGKCPICGPGILVAQPFRYLFHARYLYGVSCPSCSLTFVHPQPSAEEIAGMYQEEYFRENSEEVGAHGPRAYMEMAQESAEERKGSARRLDRALLRDRTERGRLLEIGCGPGFLLAEMRALGWTVQGLELSPFAAGYARDTLGLDVTEGAVEAGVFPRDSFDAVFMGDVLEHLPAPLASLRAVHTWLRVGSVAAIAVPSTLNLASARLGMALYRATGRCKTLRIPPYHLFEYTPQTLRAMVTSAGFEVASLEQSAVPIRKMGLRGSPLENAGKAALQLLAHGTSAVFNRGGDRLLAIALR